jgi:hypothetical protein
VFNLSLSIATCRLQVEMMDPDLEGVSVCTVVRRLEVCRDEV